MVQFFKWIKRIWQKPDSRIVIKMQAEQLRLLNLRYGMLQRERERSRQTIDELIRRNSQLRESAYLCNCGQTALDYDALKLRFAALQLQYLEMEKDRDNLYRRLHVEPFN